ncbi:MAG TPA: ATP-binding protein [Gemmatimonadota bacterium]
MPRPSTVAGTRARRPLVVKLFAAFLLLSLVALLPLGLFLYARLRAALESEITLRQRQQLSLLQSSLAAGWPTGEAGPAQIDPLVDSLARGAGGRITVVAPDGRVLGDSELSGPALLAMENHALRPEIEEALQGGEGVSTRTSQTVQEPFLYRARSLRDAAGRPVGAVRLAFTLAGIQDERRVAARALVAALGLSLLVAAALAAYVSRRLTRPIRRLREAAERLSRGELGHEIRLRTGDEHEELAGAFNRMSSELARQRSEIVAEKEQLQGVLEGMVEGVLVTDRAGRVLQTNAALQQMFGLSRPPVGRTSLEALRSPSLEEILERAIERRERAGGVVRLSHPAERQLEVEVAPLGRDGDAHAVVAVFHDVTRLKKLEGVRRDFAANVSHEIRTPVTAIRGYAETLRAAADSPEERARFAEIIIRHADRLTDLVDDLLALSTLESEGYSLQLAILSAADLLAAVEEAFRPRAAEKGILLEVGAAAPGMTLRGDRKLLDQVLANLVDNALKYTEPGGRVGVRAAREDGHVAFTVEDTGCGIPAHDLGRVFERFFRVDRARSRKLGGTGLGLAIVKHIVLLHGGDVRVQSRVGEGSSFAVLLPLEGPPGAGRPPGSENGPEEGPDPAQHESGPTTPRS